MQSFDMLLLMAIWTNLGSNSSMIITASVQDMPLHLEEVSSRSNQRIKVLLQQTRVKKLRVSATSACRRILTQF